MRRAARQAEGLSMNTRSRTQVQRCPVCGAGELLSVTLSVGGSDMSFTTCHMCEERWWEQDGHSVDLGDVLHLASNR